MKPLRITFRLTEEDQAAVEAIRDHLRRTDPWADRSAVVRFALRSTRDAVASSREGEERPR